MRRLILLAVVFSLAWLPASAFSDPPSGPLDRGFLDPPDSARPHAWWHWMNGNVTREGITADLEAMKRVGLGGAQIFHVAEGIPEGNVRFLGPEWSAMMEHAFREAARLGLELCVHNFAGWSSSGGPWVKPEQAMMVVVTSERSVQGPAQFHDVLPQPPSRLGFYRDIAVLAFPTPAGETVRMADAAPRVTASASGLDLARLVDGQRGTVVALPAPKAGQPQFVQLEFARPFLARRLELALAPGTGDFGGTIQVSDDGQTFRNLSEFQVARGDQPPMGWAFDFEPVAAKFYRILFTCASRCATVGLVEIELTAAYRINDIEGRTLAVRGDVPEVSVKGRFDPAQAVATRQVVDLTTRLGVGPALVGCSAGSVDHPSPGLHAQWPQQPSCAQGRDRAGGRQAESGSDGFLFRAGHDAQSPPAGRAARGQVVQQCAHRQLRGRLAELDAAVPCRVPEASRL